MSKLSLITVLLILLFATNAIAQVSFQWAKNMGGVRGDRGYSIAVDDAQNVYVTGYFQDTADFDPSPNKYLFAAEGSEDIFLAKYDSSGNLLWAHAFGGPGYDNGKAIALDASNNVYMIADYYGTIDFDPSASSKYLTAYGKDDIVLAKYDEHGNFIWAHGIGGGGYDWGYGLAVDDSGNAYVTGFFEDMANFNMHGQVLRNSQGLRDGFVAKYGSNGDFKWVQTVGSSRGESCNAVAIDNSGSVFVAGGFGDTVDFDPSQGTFILSPKGLDDHYLAKYTSSGQFLWVFSLGSEEGESIRGLDIDNNGDIFICGDFTGTMDLDPSPDSALVSSTSNSGQDIFIARYNNDGTYIWGHNIGGSGREFGSDLALDVHSNVYITGGFYGTPDFDPSPNVFNMTSAGWGDIYIAKYDPNAAFKWAISMGGPEGGDGGLGIATDNSYNVYVTGGFRENVDFNADSNAVHTLTNNGSIDVFITKYHQLCPGPIDVGVAQNNDTLIANSPSGTFQWVDCDSNYKAITGATKQIFKAHKIGNYAVVVTEGSCSDTSTCYAISVVGIHDILSSIPLTLYPNPAGEQVHLSFYLPEATNTTIRLYDFQGRAVYTKDLGHAAGHQAVTLPVGHLPTGMYHVLLRTEHGSVLRKVVVQR